MNTHCMAGEIIPLSVGFVKDKPVGNHTPKSPIEIPVVYIDDYSLSFESIHSDYILIIKDADGEVVYTAVVYSTMTQVTLPSILFGEYQLSLVPFASTYYYMGYIEL